MAAPESGQRTAHWLEPVSAILLSAAGLATAWATYQASLWGGLQAASYADGAVYLTDATRLDLRVGQVAATDFLMFQSWFSAARSNDEPLMLFWERRFRPEFHAIFMGWRKDFPGDLRDHVRPGAPLLSPLPEIVYKERLEANILREKAKIAYDEGDKANAVSDRFVAVTVVLSTVLFLTGISPVLKRPRVRASVLVLAGILCIAALGFLFTLPLGTLR